MFDNQFYYLTDLARLGQMRFRFSRVLPAAGKGVFIFQEPCPPWANVFSIFKSLARLGQTCFNFILLLPAPGKPVFISNCPCPRRASLFYFHFAFARVGQACFNFILIERGAEHLKENNRSQEVNHDLREHAVNRQCPRLCWCELAAFVCSRIMVGCGCFLTSRKNCWLFLSKMKF